MLGAPLGFYRLIADRIDRGDLVLAHLPESAARLAADGRYLPMSVPAVKRVAAEAGDVVCADSGVIVINDHVAADTLLIDREGRPLPAWHGCWTLAPGEVFLLIEDVPASFDSRYFGPVPVTSVIGGWRRYGPGDAIRGLCPRHRDPWRRHLSSPTAAVEVVRKNPDQVGFAVNPRRWVVERFFAWIGRNRRLAKDFEAEIDSARAFLYAASVMLLVRRIARASYFRNRLSRPVWWAISV
jgi:type IV secretory pathway protease TraF